MRFVELVRGRPAARSLALFLLVASVGGCKPQQAAPPAMPPPPVTVAKPIVQTITDYEVTTGRTAASESVDVRARVSGYLEKVTFQTLDREPSLGTAPPALKEGDDVAAQTVLFEIDPRQYDAILDAAKADLDRTTAMVDRTTAELSRGEQLKVGNNISREDYDKLVAAKAEAVATQAAARAQIKAAQLNVDFTKVKAPIAGRLGRALVTAGNSITAELTPLTTIVREDPIHVYFDLPEQVVDRYRTMIRKGEFASARTQELPVEIGIENEEGFPHSGFIDFVDNTIDRPTASLKLRGRFDNPVVANHTRFFTAGMFVRVRIPASRPYEALLVSERAIISDQGDKIVYVVAADGTVHRRVIEPGSLQGRLRVVKSGLQADERIVVNGLQRVREGAKVTPQDGPMPGLPTPTATPSATATPSPTIPAALPTSTPR
jgi:RND family efflux transporter MFP subunit